MIQELLSAPMTRIERSHVRLAFSEEMSDVGRLGLGKLIHLTQVLARSASRLVQDRPDILYYPPAGPHLVPMARDLILLAALRPLASKLVLHFHAGGLSDLYRERIQGTPLAPLFQRAYFGADAAVLLSAANPPDGEILQAQHTYLVPYGIRDQAGSLERPPRGNRPLEVLFVGAVIESKGALVLAEACGRLWSQGRRFRLTYVGHCPEEMGRAIRLRAGVGAGWVEIAGVKTGADKWSRYRSANLFCLPSFYEAETFGVVLLEAMMFGVPVIATRWRGMGDVVVDGETGLLTAPRSVDELASAIGQLLADSALRDSMGQAGRNRYLEEYTAERYTRRMENVFCAVATNGRA